MSTKKTQEKNTNNLEVVLKKLMLQRQFQEGSYMKYTHIVREVLYYMYIGDLVFLTSSVRENNRSEIFSLEYHNF